MKIFLDKFSDAADVALLAENSKTVIIRFIHSLEYNGNLVEAAIMRKGFNIPDSFVPER